MLSNLSPPVWRSVKVNGKGDKPSNYQVKKCPLPYRSLPISFRCHDLIMDYQAFYVKPYWSQCMTYDVILRTTFPRGLPSSSSVNASLNCSIWNIFSIIGFIFLLSTNSRSRFRCEAFVSVP